MSVLGIYIPEANQFYWGKYLGKLDGNGKYNQAKPKQFKYEIVSPKDKRYLHIVQNLITADDSIVIQTTWDIGFENQGTVVLQDGKKLLITNMKELTEEHDAQVNALLKDAQKTIYMELT